MEGFFLYLCPTENASLQHPHFNGSPRLWNLLSKYFCDQNDLQLKKKQNTPASHIFTMVNAICCYEMKRNSIFFVFEHLFGINKW